MSEELKVVANHILQEMTRIHTSHDRIFDKLSEQGETLVRNTTSLEEHVRRTNLLETKVGHVEVEVDGLKTHLTKINTLITLLKPTKTKVKMAILVSSLLGSLYGGGKLATDKGARDTVIQTIEQILK